MTTTTKRTTATKTKYLRRKDDKNETMMSLRTRKGNVSLQQIDELRLINKKKNDEAKKQQEEDEKRKKDEAEEERRRAEEDEVAKSKETMSPTNLHNILNGVSTEQDDASMGGESEPQEEERSPLKKRTGSSKASSRRSRSTNITPTGDTTTKKSALSTSTKSASFLDTFVYPFSRTVIELAITLKSDKAFEEFTKALMDFISNAQLVDPKFVINPINPNLKNHNITTKGEISPNMTKLGTHIKISGNGNVFNKKKVWDNRDQTRKSRKSQKEEFRDPTVYFSMIVSTEVRPQELIDRVTHEWSRAGGSRLQIKDLQTIESETVVTFFRVSTLTPKSVILAELKKILLQAQQKASAESLDFSTYDFSIDDGIELGESLPPMNLRVQVALLKGAPVNAFSKLSHQAQQARRSWHLEVDSQYAKKMKGLVEVAKVYGCVKEFWGCHAHLSEVTDANSSSREAKRQVDVAQSHTNYQLSMTSEELEGIIALDQQVNIIHPSTFEIIGSLTLRMVLLNYLKMQDGHPIIAEVHQEDFCKPTYVIIPQAEEAERMIGMMHKNLAAFLFHFLTESGFTEDFIKELLKRSCEASLVAEVPLCKWDGATRTLTTPADEKHEKVIKAFEGAAWFKDEFGILKKGSKGPPRMPQEELFNLDGTASIKTIHDRHQKNVNKGKTEIDLTKDTEGDSASHSSSSSSDDNESSDKGSRSSNSSEEGEVTGATGGG